MAHRDARKGTTSVTAVENALKTVVANIRFMGVDSPVKSIVITSSIPNEGKSFVSQKLGEALATSGKSTLLIEGDLRRRTLAARLGIHSRYGLYAALMGQCDFKDAIMRTKTPGLSFLDAEPGIPNPSDLFSSKRFAGFLDALVSSYDYVVIDTPPLSAFVDAAVLSHLADATLLVVRENFTKREQVLASYEQLQKADSNVSGVIMNYCKRRSSEYYEYYYSKKDRSQSDANNDGPVYNPSASTREGGRRSAGQSSRSSEARPSSQQKSDESRPTKQAESANRRGGGAHFADHSR